VIEDSGSRVQEIAYLFYLAEAGLIGGVAVAWYLGFRLRKNSTRVRAIVMTVSGIILLAGVIIRNTHWSLRGNWPDAIVLAASVPALLLLFTIPFFASRSWWIRAPLLALCILASGRFLLEGVMDCLGTGLPVFDEPITNERPIGNNFIWREQRFGNDVYRKGTRVSILRQPAGLPFVEYERREFVMYDSLDLATDTNLVASATINDSFPGHLYLQLTEVNGHVVVDSLM
jgi:hypothetical protein